MPRCAKNTSIYEKKDNENNTSICKKEENDSDEDDDFSDEE